MYLPIGTTKIIVNLLDSVFHFWNKQQIKNQENVFCAYEKSDLYVLKRQ